LDSLWEALVPQVPKAQTAAVHAQFTEIPHADEEPPYRTLVPSDDGVWVGQFNLLEAVPGASAAPAPARSWFVFDSDGTLKAVVHTPAGFDPNVVRGRRILGVFKDTMGVESIRTYALHRE
jgi:hypothetical protein